MPDLQPADDAQAAALCAQLADSIAHLKAQSVRRIELRRVLDERAAILNGWDRWHLDESLRHIYDERDAANAAKYLRADVRQAGLWWVAPPMCALVDHAAKSMPPHRLHARDVPEPFGMVFFGSALDGIDSYGESEPMVVNAVSWGVRTLLENGKQGIDITSWGLAVTTHGRIWTPMGGPNWWLGGLPTATTGAPADARGSTAEASAYEDCHRLAALWRLAASPGIATETTERLGRAAERRVERAGVDPSPLRVIRLRRLASSAPEYEHGTDVEWSHRWMVSGHWRNQWYPTLDDHRPVWISPYVKGPDHLPLVVKETVKALVR